MDLSGLDFAASPKLPPPSAMRLQLDSVGIDVIVQNDGEVIKLEFTVNNPFFPFGFTIPFNAIFFERFIEQCQKGMDAAIENQKKAS